MGSNQVVRLTSPTNPSVKLAAALRNARQRQKTQLTLIDGKRELRYAIAGNVEIKSIFYAEDAQHEIDDFLSSRNLKSDAQIYCCSPAVMKKLAFGDRESFLVAVARIPKAELSNDQWIATMEREQQLVIVLDQIEKPGNVGAVIRTASAIGASVVLSDPICSPFSPNSIRASQGAVFGVSLAVASATAILKQLNEFDFSTHLAIIDEGEDYSTVNLTGKTAIVFGNEASGLGDSWRGMRDRRGNQLSRIFIPTAGVVDSLNVSIAAAVIGFESKRQRK